ncbi:unnamed protein product [Didymodactylos carnosus]|uniref:N-acetylgalactosaminide beta-1,3-galactosyltransferase n=1 Tax=Didymodactylos carnosus TaxID=1234261 RepID=A0A813ZED8_9BILA|nr:unnamed protein product [Didymodactylos carnosus]CAF0897477.1 unnamed protein product [Didymodactylos carnosus]CAF3526685.1 unnamed protein product [Didymodactylos carnosus]CAF3680534.1 unnamed protein product [Didymodactylos carnosus]
MTFSGYLGHVYQYQHRVLCFVLTEQNGLSTRAKAVYSTWGKRCGKFLFIAKLNSSYRYTIYDNNDYVSTNNELPIQYIPNLPDGYYQLNNKIRATLVFIYQYYPNYDWYLKADDDTFIIYENLIRFLHEIKSNPSFLYGFRFREKYYVSGGAGYLLHKRALHLLGERLQDDEFYKTCNVSMEDIMVGQCLELLTANQDNIVGESIDEHGRERFHPLAFPVHYRGPKNRTHQQWIHFRPYHHILFGYDAFSETTISFHYITPDQMYELYTILYEIRHYDRQVCSTNMIH